MRSTEDLQSTTLHLQGLNFWPIGERNRYMYEHSPQVPFFLKRIFHIVGHGHSFSLIPMPFVLVINTLFATVIPLVRYRISSVAFPI